LSSPGALVNTRALVNTLTAAMVRGFELGWGVGRRGWWAVSGERTGLAAHISSLLKI
jgi:hypothetical protein